MGRLALLLVLALAAAGCGGDEGDARLSEQEFRDRANNVCAELERELNAIEEPQSLEELGPALEETGTTFEDALAELRGLRPPAELQGDYDRLLATGDDALAMLDRMKQAAAEGDVTEVQQLAGEAEQADEESDEIARGLGLDACATD